MKATEQSDPIVGVDLGGTKILAVVVAGRDRIVARCKKRTKSRKGCDVVLDRIADTIRGAVDEAGMDMTDIPAVGVGVPGPVNGKEGIIYAAPNLGWGRVEVSRLLSEKIDRPVFLGNDTNLSTLGELDLGAAQGSQTAFGVFVGTGIGGGLVIDGELVEGTTGAAGEFGHQTVKYDGEVANTGWRGTVESMAARPAIMQKIIDAIEAGAESMVKDLVAARLGEWDIDRATRDVGSSVLGKSYAAGDKVARRFVDESALLTGLGLANVVHLINPDTIVVGGGVVEAIGQPYVDIVAETIRANTFPVAHENLKVVEAALGDDAGVLGAVSLVRRRLQG